MHMDDITFHSEPPSNMPTMVVAFGGWVDAGEAATSALRSLVRQLAATPLATIDPEEFVDFTTIRPVVRLSADGQRRIRWPRIAFWTCQPPAGGAGLLLFRGVEPQLLLIAVASLLDLELDVAPFEAAVRAFRTQCDQAVAQDAAVQAYVRQSATSDKAGGLQKVEPLKAVA